MTCVRVEAVGAQARHLFSRTTQLGRIGGRPPESIVRSNQVTRHCAKAATAVISCIVGMPSHIRSSTVPNPGCGRMSHQTSRTVEMLPARINASRNRSNSPQPLNCGGSPAVGITSKTFVRALARPVFSDSQYGLEQASASSPHDSDTPKPVSNNLPQAIMALIWAA